MNAMMINDPNVSDAEIAAQWSIEAVRAGRVELAEAAFRIAAQAVRANRRLIDPTGPITEKDVEAARRAFVAVKNGPITVLSNTDNAPAVTAIMQAPSLRDSIPQGRRCEFEVHYAGSATTGICDQGVYWTHQLERWIHIDSEIDADHQAYVPALG